MSRVPVPRYIIPYSSHANTTPDKLLFLDQTLSRMITRFENEYPDTRLPPSPPPTTSLPYTPSNPTTTTNPPVASAADYAYPDETALSDDDLDAVPGGEGRTSRPILSRHNSDVSLASKALSQEEGRMLRFGAKFGGEEEGEMEGEDEDGGMGGVEGGELVAAVEAEAERVRVREGDGV